MAYKRLRLALGAFLLVATVVPTQASVAGTYTGTFKGKTGQGEAITFKVNKGDVVKFLKVTYEIPQCGVTATTTLRDQSAAIKKGKFTDAYDFGSGSVKVKGEMVSANKAKGTLEAAFTPFSGCQGAIETKWSANK